MTAPTAPTRESLLENWSRLSRDERPDFFRSLAHDDAADLFFSLTTWDQAELLDSLPERERRFWLRALAPDDAADVVQHFPEEERAAYLEMLDEVTRREVKALLAYKEDAAGGLMSPRFVRLRPEMTVDEAIAYVRRQASQVDSIHYAYVLDSRQRLLGVLGFRDLLAAAPNQLVRDVMRTEFVAVTEEVDQERLARLFEDWRLVAIPVIDAEGRMRGIVTVDDIVDAVEEEATEDLQKFGGSAALEGPYLGIGLRRMVRKRAGWLAVLFLGESFTATAMAHFEDEIARAVVLATFIPLIISSGGNSGSQAATLVIRAMALGEVGLRDWWRILRREIGSGLALGALLGAIGLARIVIWELAARVYGEHYLLVGLTVAVSLIGVVLLGTVTGSMLPLILRRLGFDPASASAPFVATLVDVTGVVIYFSVAAMILRGTLL